LRALKGAQGYPSVDAALEVFEDKLLARVLEADSIATGTVSLSDFALFSDWSEARLADLDRHLKPRRFALGEVLIEAGTAARSLYFLTEGRVNVSITVQSGVTRRISTIDAGNVFGELAIFGQQRRTADVVAASDGHLLELDASAISELAAEEPRLHAALALAVGRSLADRLGRANREIQALSR
jgi:CRP-like cAMP-binding protein